MQGVVMNYIVIDLEFNQDFSSVKWDIKSNYPFEIIQIGAVKLDGDYNTLDTFNRLVKPTIYGQVGHFITDLTGITTELLQPENTFPDVYRSFANFIGEEDSVFCVWGMQDVKELYKNVEYHKLSNDKLSRMYIDLQPCASLYLSFPENRQLRLQSAAEMLNIPITHPLHNAFFDAYYTAEIFKVIHNASLLPKVYDPNFVKVIPRRIKREIDFNRLYKQFEKMYSRELSLSEQELIRLAYKMGRTGQFLKPKS
jgi:DNA polymerase III epsilon subunit-like protein